MVLWACCACPLNNLMDGTHCSSNGSIQDFQCYIQFTILYLFIRGGGDIVFTGRRRGWRTQLARLFAWLPHLPVACPHVTPLGGCRQLAVTVTSLAGGQREPWPAHCSVCIVLYSFCSVHSFVLMTTFQQTPIPENRVGGHASKPGLTRSASSG